MCVNYHGKNPNMSDFKLQTVILLSFPPLVFPWKEQFVYMLCWESSAQKANIYFFKKSRKQLVTSSRMVTEYPVT